MQAWRSTLELFLFSTLIDKSPLTSNISQLLKRKEKSGLPYPHNQTFWFLVNIHIYIYIYIYMWCMVLNLCSVKRKFQCPISQPRKMIFTWNFEGGLIDHQLCFIQNFKFLAVREPAFLKSKFGQNRPLTGFQMYYRPGKCFSYFTWIWFRGSVGLFFRCIWSPLTFCVEVFEKTISHTDMIDHSFER